MPAGPKPRPDLVDMAGRCYGPIRVLSLAGIKRFPSGQSCRTWVVVCSRCGERSEMEGRVIRRGAAGCGRCRAARAGETNSRRAADGMTIRAISRATGIPLNTVYVRWRRGWPAELLNKPVPNDGRRRPQETT